MHAIQYTLFKAKPTSRDDIRTAKSLPKGFYTITIVSLLKRQINYRLGLFFMQADAYIMATVLSYAVVSSCEKW